MDFVSIAAGFVGGGAVASAYWFFKYNDLKLNFDAAIEAAKPKAKGRSKKA